MYTRHEKHQMQSVCVLKWQVGMRLESMAILGNNSDRFQQMQLQECGWGGEGGKGAADPPHWQSDILRSQLLLACGNTDTSSAHGPHSLLAIIIT